MLFSHLPHVLFPTKHNNYRAHATRTWAISLAILSILIFRFSSLFGGVGVSDGRVLGISTNINPDEVIEITNKKRMEAGVGPVTKNNLLTTAAKQKGEHMFKLGYWAHIAPDGTEPWYFFNSVGYKYRFAGENLARDFDDSKSTVDGWMASTSHRENMLSGKYQDIGVAVVSGSLNGRDTTIVVQLFGYPSTKALATEDQKSTVVAADNKEASVIPTIAPTVKQNPEAVVVVDTPPAFSPKFTDSKNFSLILVGFFGIVLLADWLIMFRKSNYVGFKRPLGHALFIGFVFLIIFAIQSGSVV